MADTAADPGFVTAYPALVQAARTVQAGLATWDASGDLSDAEMRTFRDAARALAFAVAGPLETPAASIDKAIEAAGYRIGEVGCGECGADAEDARAIIEAAVAAGHLIPADELVPIAGIRWSTRFPCVGHLLPGDPHGEDEPLYRRVRKPDPG